MDKVESWTCREDMYLYCVPNCGVGLEMGVARGNNAASLFVHTDPSKMYLCDMWHETQVLNQLGQQFENVLYKTDRKRWEHYGELVADRFKPYRDRVEIIRSDYHQAFKDSKYDDYFDWVYIDGLHQRRFVEKDLELARRIVKNNGLIMGHDFCLVQGWMDGVVGPVIESIQRGEMRLKAVAIEHFSSFLCVNLK